MSLKESWTIVPLQSSIAQTLRDVIERENHDLLLAQLTTNARYERKMELTLRNISEVIELYGAQGRYVAVEQLNQLAKTIESRNRLPIFNSAPVEFSMTQWLNLDEACASSTVFIQ